MDTERLVVLCTCPDRDSALAIASRVVEDGLAACVNVVPQITSVYWWAGQVETDEELLLVIKTNAQAYERLEDSIRDSHPYELPEIIAVPITKGLAGYLDWIDESVSAAQ